MAEQVDEKIALKTTPEFSAYSPGQIETCWSTVTMTAPFYEPTIRAEIDLVAVIDRSSSMSGSNINLVKETLDFVVDQLKENDRFSLVSYSNDANVDIPLTYMTKAKKKSAKAAVKALVANGSTALCDGLVTGMQQVTRRSGKKAQVASVLLLTDGQANVGPSTRESILDAMRNHMSFNGAPAYSLMSQIRRMNPFAALANWFSPSNASPPPVQQTQGPPQVQQVQVPPQVQQVQSPPQVQQMQGQPQVQQMQGQPQVQQMQGQPQVQQTQGPPQVQQVQGPPQVQQVQGPPQVQQTQGPPQVQQVQGPPQVQQVQGPPQVQQMQGQPPVEQVQGPPQVQQMQGPPPPPPPATATGEPVEVVPFDGTVYTFGFGANHDAGLLDAISQAAEGSYYYIDSAEKIPESFADCLGGLLSVVGQNMELSLACANGCSIAGAHAKNPPKMSDGNTKCVIQLGDLQSEEERDVLLEIKLPVTGEEAKDWAVVCTKLTYFNVISSMMEEVVADLKVDRCQEGVQQANQSVLVQKLRVTTVETLKQAKELGSKGELEQARVLLRRDIDAIEKSGLTEHAQIKFLLADLKDVLESFASMHSYQGVGSKKLANVCQSNMQQRSQSSAPNAYITKRKAMSKESFRSF